MLESTEDKFKDPEIMLFMIVEFVSSTCYSVILYNEPADLEQFKPFLYESVYSIIESNKIKTDKKEG